MKHPDWPAFVAAIVADPDDDTVRLVAADFLEENGDPDRAAFIRIQIALARLEAAGLKESPEAKELRNKERTYTSPKSTYLPLWALEECPELVRLPPTRGMSSPLAGLHVEGTEQLLWRRGFVDLVRCPAAEWLRHGVSIRMRNPVRVVHLTACHVLTRDDWYAGLPALRGLQHVLALTDLDLTEWLRGWLPGTHVSDLPF